MRAKRVIHVGPTHPGKYLLPKTVLTLEFLRDFVHLRPRTNTIDSMAEEIERRKSTDDMIDGSDKKKKKNSSGFQVGKGKVKTKLSALAKAKSSTSNGG